ncbi:glycosyltransferase family 2 protein [Flavobacterium sangjuense]|uniref:Putative glycosyltransferase n=1 Tax=Flavobacterium sangjuense TaxID=2518177 RepID=A0A4P7PTA1_9FLAO|nr:glycosyltransferase family 2 protein [Flavobacterium sangjuense]QBZ97906.1 putative glycosyltransferase [Flavobacterium sangjuense]
MKLSIVSPVYKAETIIPSLVERIEKSIAKITDDYEILLVEDCGPDNSWRVIEKIAATNSRVKGIKLSKNFGQHPAINAGLSLAKGDWIVVMDCDLQDQPEEIEKLYSKAMEGFQIVLAKRSNRKDGFLKKLSSKFFFKVYSYLTDTKFDNSIANFGIYDKKVITEVLEMNDYIKSFPLFVNWVGFNSATVEVEHAERASGKSSYSYSKLLSLAFNTIISFSNKPLKLFVKFGMAMSLISFLVGIVTIFRYFSGEISVLGYSSLMVSIWFLSGVIITIIGIVGIYIGKIFDQTKGRKPFVIQKTVNYEV